MKLLGFFLLRYPYSLFILDLHVQEACVSIPKDTILEALKILIGTALTWTIQFIVLKVYHNLSTVFNMYSLGL